MTVWAKIGILIAKKFMFFWPMIREMLKELITECLKWLVDRVKFLFAESKRRQEKKAKQKAEEAEKKAKEATNNAEADKYRAIAQVWREVAEDFRKENEKLKKELEDLENESSSLVQERVSLLQPEDVFDMETGKLIMEDNQLQLPPHKEEREKSG